VYQVLVNRGGLAEGVYTGQIVVDSDANDVTVPVILQVSNAPVVGNAGHQIVLLWEVSEPTNPLLVDVLDVAANNGQYAFEFRDVAPGEYFIMSGSDNDYDGVICDAAESCGVYPDLNSDENIVVGEDDVGGLDFLVSYESIGTNQVFAGGIGGQGFRYSVD
jgi:serine protease